MNRAAVTLLQLIKKHTSLEESHLKEEVRLQLDDPNILDASFRLLVRNKWIERGGAGWRTTPKGEDWLKDASDTASTEDEELGINDQLKKPYDVAKLKVEQRILSVFQALRKIEKNEIVMHPDFQRAFVWDLVRQSRLAKA